MPSNDLRASFRALRRTPASTSILVMTLALGVGVNTAILTLSSAVLWKQLPFHDPQQLVSVWSKRTDRDRAPLSLADLKDFRAGAASLSDIAAFTPMGANLIATGDPERLEGVRATPNIFALLGVKSAAGRLMTPQDGLRVVVLSHALWQRSFGGAAAVIGRTLSLNGEGHLVLGVLPADFFFPVRDADFVVPLAPETDPRRLDRGDHFLSAIARLRPGADPALAEQQLTAVARRLQAAYPATNLKNSGVRVIGLADEVVGNFRSSLRILTGAAGLLLLMACSSMAGLSLARFSARRHEFAVRSSLGAGRLALARQVLAETLLVSLAGGGAAIAVAYGGVDVLKALSPPGLPRLAEVHIDGRLLALNMALAIVSGLFTGLMPALAAARSQPGEAMKAGSRSSLGGSGLHIRGILSAVQLALSVVLLIGAGLLLRSFVRVQSVQPGFAPSGAVVLRLAMMPAAFPAAGSVAVFEDALRAQFERMGGVESAGAISILPMSGVLARADFTIAGHPPPSPEDTPSANYRIAGPGYFRAMKIPLMSGRDFADTDTSRTARVAIVSESLARRFWPVGGAVGAHLRIDGFGSGEVEVAGVAGDVRQVNLTDPPGMDLYLPYAQAPAGALPLLRNNMYWVIRSPNPGAVTAARAAVRAAGKDVAVSSAMPLEEYVRGSLAPRKFNLVLLAAFAVSALLLAVIAVYGVISHSVTLRTREMGLRMALGAQAGDVRRLIVRQGLALTLSGATAGIAGAMAASRLMAGVLYQTEPLDATTFVAVGGALIVAGVLASYFPAVRATRVDPLVALKE